jgi:anti-sigma factor RsiW
VECRDVQNLLHLFVDGELDVVRRLQIEHHLADCRACAEREQGVRQLRDALSAAPLYHRAPDALRARLQTDPTPQTRPNRSRARALMALAAGIVLVVVSVGGGVLLSRTVTADERLADVVVAGHIRSLQVEHAIDVASNDQHIVKPWFQRKLDFSPQVPNLAPAGFPLTGGRLDYLIDRPVAAIIYHRRAHLINVFTWPSADGDGVRGVRALHRHGFHIRHWHRAGMTYWVISDLNGQELDEFVGLFQSHVTVATP